MHYIVMPDVENTYLLFTVVFFQGGAALPSESEVTGEALAEFACTQAKSMLSISFNLR